MKFLILFRTSIANFYEKLIKEHLYTVNVCECKKIKMVGLDR